jgi:hypothetical protein
MTPRIEADQQDGSQGGDQKEDPLSIFKRLYEAD